MSPSRKLACCLCLGLFVTAQATSWNLCGDGVVAVSGVDVTPDPAVVGQEVQFHVRGDSGEAVSDGVVQTEVYYLGFKVYSMTGNLCDGGNCPAPAGAVEFKFGKTFPRLAPTGSYSIKLHASDGNRDMFCVELHFTLVRAPLLDGWKFGMMNRRAS